MQLLSKLKSNVGLLSVFMIGFMLRLFMAHLDPFLHDWDERFHALVAKNMMQHPFTPMLFTEAYSKFDPNAWCCNTVWLHKQPLFLWQIAISMKIFGVSEFTLRLPSVLMGSLMIVLVYRICFLLTSINWTSMIAALIMCFSNFQLEQISGRQSMDHNDVTFGFYVLASIWAYAEYLKNPKWYWAALIGLFSGCAVLNKWLTGLLVFSAWSLKLFWDLWNRKSKSNGQYFLLSVLICFLVFLPWQLYIFNEFPNQALFEFDYNTKHIFEVVEEHIGGIWYYYDNFHFYFGEGLQWFLFLGILISLLGFSTEKILNRTILFYATLVFCFFSFVVQSKLISYFFVVCPLLFIYIAIGIEYFFAVLRNRYWILIPLLLLFLFKDLNPQEIYNYRVNNKNWENKKHNTEIYKNLQDIIPKETIVILNTNQFENIDLMFYNDNLTAYHYCLEVQEDKQLFEHKIPTAVFENRYGYNVHQEITNNSFFYTIHQHLK